MRIRISESLGHAREIGKRLTMTGLAKKCLPDRSMQSARNTLYNLNSGKKKSVDVEIIDIICQECEVTRDFLLKKE